jgi:hypothetical protein
LVVAKQQLIINNHFLLAIRPSIRKASTMPHTHAQSKAEAIHEALDEYQESHHHAPDTHEKARLVSDTVSQWEREEVAIHHPPQ